MMNGTSGYGLFEVFTQEWLDELPIDAVGSNKIIIQSIQDHLSRLLNARQGALPHLPDYGLPDITEAYTDLPYTIGKLQKEITTCIKKYEPRVGDVEVIGLPNNRAKGVVLFEIRLTLLNGHKTTFETYFKSGGDAKVIKRNDLEALS